MGLDMYLYKKIFIWSDKRKDITITGIPRLKTDNVKYISEEVAYWRKANAIHNWFVNNVQGGVDDCREYYVDKEQLRELLDTINKVLKNRKFAPELLPTQSGFFFGSTDYDKFYFEDLKYTKRILKEILSNNNDDDEGFYVTYYYVSSW